MNKFYILLSLLFSLSLTAAEFVPGEYIVKTNNKAVLKTVSKSLGNDVYKIKASKEQAEELKSVVEYIEPNYIYHASATPAGQWGLPAIDVEKAWKVTKGDKNIRVVVVDTGIDCEHPALKGHCDPGWDFVADKEVGFDDQGHGTHCAGVIAADSSKVMGVAPKVTVIAAKFLNSNGSGTLEDAIEAINYGIEKEANILSNSWGGGGYSQALRDVIALAKEKGILFVAAAGNDYSNNDKYPSYPASYEEDNVISVAAATSSMTKAYFSNYGKETVHLFAPGYNILSTIPGNGTASMSGTSMATPFVAGVAALLFSKGETDYYKVKDTILRTVEEGPNFTGYVITDGIVNAGNALQ